MSCLQPTIFEAPAFLASPSSSEGGVPFLDPFFFLFRLRTWRTIEARVVQHLTPHSDYCEARLLGVATVSPARTRSPSIFE